MNYYMGIDNGGSFCKALIFDSKGREVSSAKRNLEMICPKSGFTERDMDELWIKNLEVIKESFEKSGLLKEEIKGISVCGHGKGLYLWGKDGKPAYNGIVSTDTRAWEYAERWEKDGTSDRIFEKTYQKVLACQPVAILSWLRDNDKEIIENTKWIFEVKDYIRFRLTGEAFAEVTDYSGTNMMNLKTKTFDRELLSEFSLGYIYDKLPKLKNSTDICGKITREVAEITGLKEGTVVAGGMFDIDACALGMNITDEGRIAVIAGTWSINEYISKKPVENKTVMMNSLYAIDGYYLIEESSPTSASNNAWFSNLLLKNELTLIEESYANIYKYCDDMVSSVKGEESNIVFLPYIFGSNYNPKARACFVGLESYSKREDMLRAVYEGVVFAHKVHLEKLLMNRENTEAIRIAGGVINSNVWIQMVADIFELPVEIIEVSELGALGCAMAAAVAFGEFSDLKNAAKAMTNVKKVFSPNQDNFLVYRNKYDRFKKVSKALEEVW